MSGVRVSARNAMSGVRVSARNRLPGTVLRVKLSEVMAQITIRVGRQTIDAVITRDSAEEMGLKKGDRVAALIKSTEVMVLKDEG